MTRWSASTIAGIETGRRRPTSELAVAADEALQTGALLAHLLRIADEQRTPVWFAPWRGYEAETTRLCAFEPTVIPGLLQTEEYARAVLAAASSWPTCPTTTGSPTWRTSRMDRWSTTQNSSAIFVASGTACWEKASRRAPRSDCPKR
jgi:hypothetical protein